MLTRPPAASRLSNLFATLAEASTRLAAPRAWALTLAAYACAISVDYATGPKVNMGSIYLIIACFTAWCLGEWAGLAVGLSSVVIASIVNVPQLGLSVPTATWNIAMRALSMGMLVILASGMRHALDQARWRASTDGLTGALNKSAFTRQMESLVSQAQRRGEALVVAYIDLDGFKGVNDGFGHAAGDAVLRNFAEAASGMIRSTDLFARIGGDEFIALLTAPSCAQGDVVAERLHTRLATILRTCGHDVTCSIGALVLEGHQVVRADRLIDAADSLMYEVKRSGKNALRIARCDLQPVRAPSLQRNAA